MRRRKEQFKAGFSPQQHFLCPVRRNLTIYLNYQLSQLTPATVSRVSFASQGGHLSVLVLGMSQPSRTQKSERPWASAGKHTSSLEVKALQVNLKSHLFLCSQLRESVGALLRSSRFLMASREPVRAPCFNRATKMVRGSFAAPHTCSPSNGCISSEFLI